MPPTDVGARVAILEERVDSHKDRLDDLHERVRSVEPRVVGTDSVLGQLKEQVSQVKMDVSSIEAQCVQYDKRIDRLETKLGIAALALGILIPVTTQALGWVREVYLPATTERAYERHADAVPEPSGIDVLTSPTSIRQR